jgi:hypothetical protein
LIYAAVDELFMMSYQHAVMPACVLIALNVFTAVQSVGPLQPVLGKTSYDCMRSVLMQDFCGKTQMCHQIALMLAVFVLFLTWLWRIISSL